jgi:hypothetical protein
MWEGSWTFDTPPSPNDHTHEVGVFVEESTNWTGRGIFPEVAVASNAAAGTAATLLTVIYPLWEIVLLPAALVAVRVTV